MTNKFKEIDVKKPIHGFYIARNEDGSGVLFETNGEIPYRFRGYWQGNHSFIFNNCPIECPLYKEDKLIEVEIIRKDELDVLREQAKNIH